MIEIKNIESLIVEASQELERVGLYEFLRNNTGSRITYRLTKSQFDIVSALELMFASYTGVFEHAENVMDTETYNKDSEDFRQRRVFANRYALYIGSKVGLQYLHAGERQKQREEIIEKKLNFIKPGNELTKEISDHLMRFLREATKSDNTENRLFETVDTYLHSLKNTSLIGATNYENLFSKYPTLEHATVLSIDFKRFQALDAQKRDKTLTFDDYAGQEEVVKELKKVAEFVKNPLPFKIWGAKTPKGFVLVGPPGTGKTYLARVFADECNIRLGLLVPMGLLSRTVRDDPDKPVRGSMTEQSRLVGVRCNGRFLVLPWRCRSDGVRYCTR